MKVSAILPIMSELQDEIMNASKDGDINCTQALAIAKKLKIPPKEVGAKIDELGIKIHNCQLGCFE
jgi:hypothetical protein